MTDCIFCAIAKKERPAEIEYEDKDFIAFKDIYPKAPIHILLIPKKHIHSVDHVELADRELMGSLILAAQKIARQKGLQGYQLHFNVGKEGGQVVDHIHLHILAEHTNHEV